MGMADGFEHPGCTVTILNIGTMNDKADQKTNRISDNVALTAFDLLACIIAANTPTFSGFDRLTVSVQLMNRDYNSTASAPLAC